MASNEDAGIQLNVIQGLDTLPLLRVPVFLAQPEIAQRQIRPMGLPRAAAAPRLLWHLQTTHNGRHTFFSRIFSPKEDA